MRKVYTLSLFIFFIALSCKTKPVNPDTTFFKFLKGRSISGPVEFWHMNIKGKNLYFFSDAHEEEKGACPNCPGPMCDRIEMTLDKYFRKQDSASHFFIESNFQIKDTAANENTAANEAFLSKTITHFKKFLEIGTSGRASTSDFPNTHFHYGDIRNVTPILSEISSLRDAKYRIQKGSSTPGDAQNFIIVGSLLTNYFSEEQKVKSFLDLFVYSASFKEDYDKLNHLFLSGESKSYLEKYSGKPHRVASELFKLEKEGKEDVKKALETYYEEEFKKINTIYNESYQETFRKGLAKINSATDAINSKAFEHLYMTFFEYNYLLSNIYLLGRAMRRLEDRNDKKDLIFYWGGAHSQHLLQFLSRYYKTPIKPVDSERRNFRCIKVH